MALAANNQNNAASKTLAVWASALALGAFALMQFLSFRIAGGFDFPLDDVYIHLAIAEQIFGGNYGVNSGEVASAASSPLYPLLLIPFSGSQSQVIMPVLWNVVAVLASAWLWARIVGDALRRDDGGLSIEAMILALVGPLALNMVGVAFTGMENALHVALSLAVVRGIQILFAEDRVSAILIIGMVFGPLIRFEGLGVSMVAMLALVWQGRMIAGILAGALAVLPIIAFMYFLTRLGLDKLPNSVNAKLANNLVAELPLVQKWTVAALVNFQKTTGKLFAVVLIVAAFAGLGLHMRRHIAGRILLLATLAGGGHYVLGQFGWVNRYEIYAFSFLMGMVILAIGQLGSTRLPTLVALAMVLVCGYFYTQQLSRATIYGPRSITLQQGEMARFAKDYLRAPVAVNDLGYVAWQNPDYVLDLWGLASKEALAIRGSDPAPHWAAPLAAEKNVDLAMIYDNWLGDAIGENWVLLGRLHLEGPQGTTANHIVSFYATRPDAVATLTERLGAFAPTLPTGVRFEFSEATQ